MKQKKYTAEAHTFGWEGDYEGPWYRCFYARDLQDAIRYAGERHRELFERSRLYESYQICRLRVKEVGKGRSWHPVFSERDLTVKTIDDLLRLVICGPRFSNCSTP